MYQIINYATGEALAVNSGADDVSMQQRAANDDAQLWMRVANPEQGDYDIVNKKTGGHLAAIRANGQLLCGAESFGWDIIDFSSTSLIATNDDEWVIGVWGDKPQLAVHQENERTKWTFEKV
ncbi:RICIN domain-containing protein [Nocardia sp. Marseille-Q1738]